ncbi:hypothetical protein RND81_01G101000 [Saponaria officinalis]|uniref:Uncharacterized protein n=1 Tax=Saponaria officinalis TaxID=3572 RepID=A0AAW1NHR6_SAPOF
MSMWFDLGLQALMFVVGIGIYLWMNDDIPRKLIHRYYSYRNRNSHQSRRHFVKAAELLSKARSYPASSPQRVSLAASCAVEAEAAVGLDPSDAANHIVRALALDLQGYKTSALEALDTALSPLAAGSLSPEEKADALLKRAQLRMEMCRDESVLRVAEAELREAVKLKKREYWGRFRVEEERVLMFCLWEGMAILLFFRFNLSLRI